MIIEIKSKLYEDKSYWDKAKGYSTHERTCIGKLGADSTHVYNKHCITREEIQGLVAEAEKAKEVSSTTFVGEPLVLDKASGNTGVSRILAESFGEDDAKDHRPGLLPDMPREGFELRKEPPVEKLQ